jgi:hypothetical protein
MNEWIIPSFFLILAIIGALVAEHYKKEYYKLKENLSLINENKSLNTSIN